MIALHLSGPAALTPGLRVPDPDAAYWLSQVHLRLRRESGWCWLQRLGYADPRDGSLPPVADAARENLDWVRFEDQKRRFFNEDPGAAYLTACLASLEYPAGDGSTWAMAAAQLALTPAAQFVLALALAQRLDAGLAPVFAACMNDQSRPYPTLALAQRLWDDPAAIALAGDDALWGCGLLRCDRPDDHLAWHVKNLPLHVFFERGVLGILAFGLLLGAALARLHSICEW